MQSSEYPYQHVHGAVRGMVPLPLHLYSSPTAIKPHDSLSYRENPTGSPFRWSKHKYEICSERHTLMPPHPFIATFGSLDTVV